MLPCNSRLAEPEAIDQSAVTNSPLRSPSGTTIRVSASPPEYAPHGYCFGQRLRQQITVDGVEYTDAVDPNGFRLIGKGKRKPQVELHWIDLLSGNATMAVALNASLSPQTAAKPTAVKSPNPVSDRVPKKSKR